MKNSEDKDLNSTQLKSALQYTATALAAYIAGRGWLPADTAGALMNWIAMGVPVLIALWQNRDKGRLQEASKVKDENGTRVQIIASDDLANSIPRDNVIPRSEVTIVPKGETK